MAMSYDPNAAPAAPVKPLAGTYGFIVDRLEEVSFRSGNRGAKAVLRVHALPDKDVNVFASFVYLPNALWKLRQFFDAVGMDFSRPPDPLHFSGLKGVAEFALNERGYLEPAKFLPAHADKGPDAASMSYTAQAPISVSEDEIPF